MFEGASDKPPRGGERAGTPQAAPSAHADARPPEPPTDAEPTLIVPAEEISGRYEEACEFARGGIGRILLVHDAFLDRDVALKELVGVDAAGLPLEGSNSSDQTTRTLAARFVQEARLTSQLQHPSIVPVHEIGRRADGTLYYTMKYVRGRTLRQAISEARSLEERLGLLPHFLDLCHAIAYAHSRGVIHRDVKPANVMIGEFGETLVIDWGLAKVKGNGNGDSVSHPDGRVTRSGAEQEHLDAELTQDGTWVGTPSYMAPEQARGDLDAVCQASDVYALGATLYHLLTGRCPFVGGRETVIAKVMAGDHPPVRAVDPKVPAELVAICNRAMRRKPEKRYESGSALAGEVHRFLSGALVESYHYSWNERFWRFVKRRKPLVLSIVVSVSLLLTIGIVSYVQVLRAHDDELAHRLAAEEANRQLVWENYTATVGIAQERLRNDSHSTARELLHACPVNHRQWEWGHLMRQSSPDLLSLYPDTAPGMPVGRLRRAVFSPDGRFILDDRYGNGVKSVFDLQAGRIAHTTRAYPGWSECTQFTPNGEAIVVSTGRHTAAVIDPRTDEALLELDSGSGILRSIVIDPTRRIVAGYHFEEKPEAQNVILWDYATGDELRRFPMKPYKPDLYPPLNAFDPAQMTHAEGPLGAVLGFLDGSRYLVCADEELFVLDTKTGNRGPCIHQCLTRSVAYAPGPALAVVVESSDPYPVAIWDVRSRTRLAGLAEPVPTQAPLAISPDGAYVATAEANLWRLWSAHTGRLIANYDGHTEDITAIAFSPNNACVLTTSPEEVKIWASTEKRDQETVPFTTQDGIAVSVQFVTQSPGGPRVGAYDPQRQRLAGATPEGDITVWRLPSFRNVATWHGHDKPIRALAFTPDGSQIATGSADGTARTWDVKTGRPGLTVNAGPGGEVSSVAFSDHGGLLALGLSTMDADGERQHEVRVLDATTGTVRYLVDQGAEAVSLLAFSPDGARLFVGIENAESPGGRILVFDAQSGSRQPAFVNGIGVPWAIEFPSNPDQVLVLGDDGYPVLWDLKRNQKKWRLRHVRVRHFSLCPCGSRLAVVSVADRLSVHAIEDGRQLITLGRGQEPAAFSPDGLRLFAVGNDVHARIFHADDHTIPDRASALQSGLREVQRRLGLLE